MKKVALAAFGILVFMGTAFGQRKAPKKKPPPEPVLISEAFTQVLKKIPDIKTQVRKYYVENNLNPESALSKRLQDIISNKLKFEDHVGTHTISISPYHFAIGEVPLAVAKYLPTFIKDTERIQTESFLAALRLDQFVLPGTYNYQTDPNIDPNPETFEFPYFFASALMNRFADPVNQCHYDPQEGAKSIPLTSAVSGKEFSVRRSHEHSALVKSLSDLNLDHFDFFGKYGWQAIGVKKKNFVYFTTNNSDIDLITCRAYSQLSINEEQRARTANYIIGLSRGGDWTKYVQLDLPIVVTTESKRVLMRNFIHVLEQSFYAQFETKLNIKNEGFFYHRVNNKKPFVLSVGYSKWITLMVHGLAEQSARRPSQGSLKPKMGTTDADNNRGKPPPRAGYHTVGRLTGVGPGYAAYFRDGALDFSAVFRKAHKNGARVMTVTDLDRLFKMDTCQIEVMHEDGNLMWALTDFLIRGRIGNTDLLPRYRLWIQDISSYNLEATDPATDKIIPGKLSFANFQRYSFLVHFADAILAVPEQVKSRWLSLKKANPRLLGSDLDELARFEHELDFIFREYIYSFEGVMTEWMFEVYVPEMKNMQINEPLTGHGKVEGLVTQLVERPLKPVRAKKR